MHCSILLRRSRERVGGGKDRRRALSSGHGSPGIRGRADAATPTLTLDPDLLARFVAEAAMRPADDVLREPVRGFVDGRGAARDAEIERALREADDPRTAFVSDEEVEAEWTVERAALLRRIGDDAA